MHGAPAEFPGRDLGGTVRSAKGTDGHGRGRSRARRVPAGRWRGVVSVVPGWGVGPVGFRSGSSCRRVGRAGAAAPFSVPHVCGDARVASGDVAAAQGLFAELIWAAVVAKAGRGRAPLDRASVGDSGIDGPRVAAGDHRAGGGGAALVHLGRGRAGVDVSIPKAAGSGCGDALAAVEAAREAIATRFGDGSVIGAVTSAGVAVGGSGGRLLSPGWPPVPAPVVQHQLLPDAGGCDGSSSRG